MYSSRVVFKTGTFPRQRGFHFFSLFLSPSFSGWSRSISHFTQKELFFLLPLAASMQHTLALIAAIVALAKATPIITSTWPIWVPTTTVNPATFPTVFTTAVPDNFFTKLIPFIDNLDVASTTTAAAAAKFRRDVTIPDLVPNPDDPVNPATWPASRTETNSYTNPFTLMIAAMETAAAAKRDLAERDADASTTTFSTPLRELVGSTVDPATFPTSTTESVDNPFTLMVAAISEMSSKVSAYTTSTKITAIKTSTSSFSTPSAPFYASGKSSGCSSLSYVTRTGRIGPKPTHARRYGS